MPLDASLALLISNPALPAVDPVGEGVVLSDEVIASEIVMVVVTLSDAALEVDTTAFVRTAVEEIAGVVLCCSVLAVDISVAADVVPFAELHEVVT